MLFRSLEGDSGDFAVKRGRLFRKGCDAELGDVRCGVVTSLSAYSGIGTISTVRSATEFEVTGLGGFENGWFTDGLLQWTSGLDNGGLARISTHSKSALSVVINLRDEPRLAVVAGATFSIKAGCDKSFGTCKAKFANALNFRGFPHMPGNDQAYAYAREGMNFDGGPVVQ